MHGIGRLLDGSDVGLLPWGRGETGIARIEIDGADRFSDLYRLARHRKEIQVTQRVGGGSSGGVRRLLCVGWLLTVRWLLVVGWLLCRGDGKGTKSICKIEDV